MKDECDGFTKWIDNHPKNDDEWFALEVGWCKTYLEGGISIPNKYFSSRVIEQAKAEIEKVIGEE